MSRYTFFAPKRTVLKGSNVYVRDPQRIVPDCVSITGDVLHIMVRKKIRWAIITGYVAKTGGGYPFEGALRYEDLGERIGTPISKISTQPGSPGYGEWCRISNSWDYP